MSLSWSAMRKVLEQENICASLKGRVQYFVTRYRKSHDEEGRVAVRLDGKEIFQSCFYDWERKRPLIARNNAVFKEQSKDYWEYWNKVHLETKNQGGFDQHGFYKAFYEYCNQSIENSLLSPDPVVRLLAVMDKRTGKRRLESLAPGLADQPAWLQVFYKLRLEAEGLVVPSVS